jgi:hypothetical protein
MQNFSQNMDVKVAEVSNVSIIAYHPKSAFSLFSANQDLTLSNSLAQVGL